MFTFENFKLKHSSVYANLSEAKGDKEEYQKFFDAALKKFGATSPSQLKGDKKKEFFDYVDKNWRGDHEEKNAQAEAMEIGTYKYAKHCKKMTPGEKIEEGGMPSSVIKAKQNLANMSDSEFAMKYKDKSAADLQAMAWRHGYGKGSNFYVDKRTRGSKTEQNENIKVVDYSNYLEEKAVSQQQQKLMGLALAVKRGDIEPQSDEIQKLADSMTTKELEKYATGKHKDLPVKKEEKITEKQDSKEKTGKKNKITIDPEMKEDVNGYSIIKKYKMRAVLENKIINYLKEVNDGGPAFSAIPVDGEHDAHGNTHDMPPSASSIAKAYGISPIEVQDVLDKMVRMGTITRVGDAYSYGPVEVAR